MQFEISQDHKKIRKTLYAGLMEIMVDFMTDMVAHPDHYTLVSKIASLEARVEGLERIRIDDRREFLDAVNKSSESRKSMHEKMDSLRKEIYEKIDDVSKSIATMQKAIIDKITPEVDRAKNIEVILLRWVLGIIGAILIGYWVSRILGK